MSGFGSPRPTMPTPKGGDAQAFEEKLAAYGFEPVGFEKISTSRARATGLAVKDDEYLETLEQDHEQEKENSEKIEAGPVRGKPQRPSTQYRRFAVIVILVGIVGGGAAAGILLGGGEDSKAAVVEPSTDSPTALATNRPTPRRATRRPTRNPTIRVTGSPVTNSPTTPAQFSLAPTSSPTMSPTTSPVPTPGPTKSPSVFPTPVPTTNPTPLPTGLPTRFPTNPTRAPTFARLSTTQLKATLVNKLRLSFGWRDRCRDCTTGPDKLGVLIDATCSVTGSDSSCITAHANTYAGIDLDGTVDNSDRFYLSLDALNLNCGLSSSTACASGTPLQRAVYDLRYLCVGFGWRDDCDGCTLGPTKLQETCVDSSLSEQVVGANTRRGSFNLEGRVNSDDNFYATAFVHPSAPAQSEMLDYARSFCFITFGWRDECESCTDGPSKRGSVFFDSRCTSVTGSDSRCLGRYVLISPDGRVDGNDKFYMALTCRF